MPTTDRSMKPAQTDTGDAPETGMDLSIVVPIFNEAENIKPFHDELNAVLDTLDKTSEIIFIDDGSSDHGYELLQEVQRENPRIRVVRFRRNFGQTAAMAAGLDYARGEIVVTMDGDQQNDPGDIPALLDKVAQGFDLVCGWRHDRKDKYWSRRFPSQLANKLISRTTDVELHDYGCTLKAMRKVVAKNITLYGEMHRFIPAVASHMGVHIAEVKVNHRPRTLGRTKYGISRTFRVLLDLITVNFLLKFAGRPMHFFGLPGLVSGIIGIMLALYTTFERLFLGVPMGNRPVFLLAILMILIGIQFIVIGLLGEMQIRTYYETQNKPIYIVKDTLGWDGAD
jgi:glycosyltransferase involved in cell wall biosynthesis